MESPGAVGEPLPPTPAAAMAGDGLRRSEKPSGLAGKAGTRPITHPEVLGIGEAGVEGKRAGQVETNRAVVIAGAAAAGLLGGRLAVDSGVGSWGRVDSRALGLGWCREAGLLSWAG